MRVVIKKFFRLLILTPLLITTFSGLRAQEVEAGEEDEDQVYTFAEQMPEFPEGLDALLKYLRDSIKVPDGSPGGTVYMNFTVTKTGKVTKIHAVKEVKNHPELTAEATRVLSGMPDWKPGKQNGKPVAVYYTVPIRFAASGNPVTPKTPGVIGDENKVEQAEPVYEYVEQNPSFPGGTAKLEQFLKKNLKNPGGKTGTAYIKFIVGKDGVLRDFKVIRGVPGAPELNDEALRVMKLMPVWQPARQNGKPVDSYYTLPVKF